MKVLFYSNMGLAPQHFGTELELIESLQKQNNDVYLLRCGNTLKSCYFNPCHNLIGCAICTSRTEEFHNYLGIKEDRIYTLRNLTKGLKIDIPNFKNLEDLINWHYKGVNLGRGIASSVVSLERDSSVTEKTRQRQLIEIQAEMAINSLLNFEAYLDEIKPDMVYLFNGRFAEQFPLLELCQSLNIPFKTYEVGSDKQKYRVFDNSLPHSIKTISKLIQQVWKEGNNVDKDAIAQEWFTSKRKGTNLNQVDFLKEQKQGKIPSDFNLSKRNIVIFNSSEDEMKAIGEWNNPIYKSQNEAIQKIVSWFAKHHPEFHFYVRMHPNLDKIENAQTKELYAINSYNFTLIPSNAAVDSFAMVENCEKTITFGSTVGIEATFWGYVSILFGKGFYESLDVAYQPNSFEKLFELLKQKNLAPKPKEHTYKYAYYYSVCGTNYIRFKNGGKLGSYFNDKKMNRITLKTLTKLFSLLPNIKLWTKLNKIILDRPLGIRDLFKLKSHITK